ncbi:AMP-binding protein [Agrobacterium vitis]|uniref:AMP-binding protein n=2 Tax=Agrobacterium vitis TaxID=373 RepID=A0AAE5AYE8_AGRVI|nr:AMP-binding protein [Agrobacterium vitis]MCF1500979.1 AMP-binding protein [Allorhizobium sp. Av2]MCM2442437.1 AMP-binding protein [Agrobacterium vitis]MUZ60235.1 AMP-binding protein [Agrobacterium vitis]MVA67664.1 AMP-binding protein [Agrobacterium vitis]MVA89869.1 AMP-binding protein [Agrobacterium vitis]
MAVNDTSWTQRTLEGSSEFTSIIHMLENRSRDMAGDVAMRFFHDDAVAAAQAKPDSWTWRMLRDRARLVGREIAQTGLVIPGARILVVYPPGLSFIAAFLGCLYAGTVPVPVPAPRRADGINRWLHIARDAGISGILCAGELLDALRPLQQAVGHGFALAPEAADPATSVVFEDDGRPFHAPEAKHVAFLQYTSGSTSDPKGVMVTHGNLMANLRQISTAFEYGPSDISACWLPHYHDMGLIDGILSPVFNGFPVALMAPASFLRRPLRFLELASHVRATVIGGPNFSYEHCVDKYAPEAAAGLDLSNVRIAYNGAEPIRPKTLERFTAAFAPHGFHGKAFYCCYGQAEATLFQTGNSPDDPPLILSVSRKALVETGAAVEADDGDEHDKLALAACGRPAEGLDLALVDPEAGLRVDDGMVGEIWIRGPNVTPGYWGRAKLNAETFDQVLDGSRGWRRTGDLGFRRDGQLYITGRLKDLVIIRGQNHHPEDIEQSVFSSHPALAQGRAGVFAIEVDGEEQLGVVCELTREGLRDIDSDDVIRAVRGAVSCNHNVRAAVIALLRPSSLPRTPSGKVRRFACRQGIVTGDLRIVARWDAKPESVLNAPAIVEQRSWRGQLQQSPKALRKEALRHLLRQEVAMLARLGEGDLPANSAGFFDLGLDSVALVNIGATVERELGVPVRPTLIFEHPTILALSDHLYGLIEDDQSEIAPLQDAKPQSDGPVAQNPPAFASGSASVASSAITSELAALKALLR